MTSCLAPAGVAACCLLTVGLLVAQQPAPLFRVGSKLVEVEVTVLDKKGNPVTGLTQADFTVSDEGKPQPVAFFHFDGAPEPPPAANAPAAVERKSGSMIFSNRVDSENESPNVTALVLDGLNTPPQQSVVVRAQVLRYLRALAPQTRVAIFYMGPQNVQVIHDFTADAAALRARLEKAVVGIPAQSVTDYEQSIHEAEAFVNMFAGTPTEAIVRASMVRQLATESAANSAARQARVEHTLEALEILGRHLAALPGRKNLVWIGAGFSLVSIDTTGRAPYTVGNNFEARVRDAARRLAQYGVVLYIVDSSGVPGGPFNGTSPTTQLRPPQGPFEDLRNAEDRNNDPHMAMTTLASITGGRYLFNTNDLTSGFKQAASDIQGSYRLGFYAPEEQQEQWHRLKVQVKRSGVTVRHREGYRTDAPAPQPVPWTEKGMNAVLGNPLGSSVIPLTARYGAASAGERVLDLAIGVEGIHFHRDGDDLKAELQVAVSELTTAGEPLPAFTTTLHVSVPAAKWDEASKAGIPFHRQWTPSAAAARTRVVVLDAATGQFGSVDIQAR